MPENNNNIAIRGREFKAVTNSTMRHDVWTSGQIEKAGLTRIVLQPGETPEEFAQRMYREVALNGNVFLLLGGLLMPAELAPEKWTPELAGETAEHLAGATDPLDKAIINAQIMSALASFLATGLASLVTSPNFSAKPQSRSEAAGGPQKQNAGPIPTAATPAAAPTTAHGVN